MPEIKAEFLIQGPQLKGRDVGFQKDHKPPPLFPLPKGTVTAEQLQSFLKKGELTPHEADLVVRQIRAGMFLYTGQDSFKTDNPTNPVTDSMIYLASGIRDHRFFTRNESRQHKSREGKKERWYLSPDHYSLVLPGEPASSNTLLSVAPSQKEFQRSQERDQFGRQLTFRTLHGMEEYPVATLRSLHLLNAVAAVFPQGIDQSIDEYVQVATESKSNRAATALGLLEIMNNMNLLDQADYSPLVSQLRKVVLAESGSPDTLKKTYRTRLTVNPKYHPFWIEGAVEALQHEEESDTEIIAEIITDTVKETINLPSTHTWDLETRLIAQRQDQIAGLRSTRKTLTESILEQRPHVVSATPGSKPNREYLDASLLAEHVIQRRKKNRAEVAVLSDLNRQAIRETRFKYKSSFSEILEKYQPKAKLTDNEMRLLQNVAHVLINHFARDRKLDPAVKTQDPAYLNPYDIAKSPLLTWVFALREPQALQQFQKAIDAQPESFAVLARLMVDDLAIKSFNRHTGETNFLFDPDYMLYRENTRESLEDLIKKLAEAVSVTEMKPKALNIHEVFDLVLKGGYEEPDKIWHKMKTNSLMEGVRKRLSGLSTLMRGDLQHRGFPWLFPKVRDRAVRFTAEDALVLAGGILVGALGYQTIPQIYEELVTKPGNQMFESWKLWSDGGSIPDQYGRKTERPQPRLYGKIVHLPEEFSHQPDGQEIGFLPQSTLFLQLDPETGKKAGDKITTGFDRYDSLESNVAHGHLTPFSSIVPKANPEKMGPKQLAYYLNYYTYRGFYPLEGWELSQVATPHESDQLIVATGILGFYDIAYPHDKDKPVVVLERRDDIVRLNQHLSVMTEPKALPYTPVFDYRFAMQINQTLSGDPRLQDLDRRFIDEFSHVYRDPDRASETILKYLAEFGDFIDQNRYYDLSMDSFDVYDDKFYMLQEIASRPNDGFYCSVAANATEEFTLSVGIRSGLIDGIPVRRYGDEMWGDWGHEKTVIFLPNGRVVIADMTPRFTYGKTAQSTIDLLAPRAPTEEDRKREEDRYGDTKTPLTDAWEFPFFKNTPKRTSNTPQNTPSSGPQLPFSLPALPTLPEVNPNFQIPNFDFTNIHPLDIDLSKVQLPDLSNQETLKEIAESLEVPLEIAGFAAAGLFLLNKGLKPIFARRRLEQALNGRPEFNHAEQKMTGAVLFRLGKIPYNTQFSKRAARLLGLVNRFSLKEQGLTLQWLTESREGLLLLERENPHLAFQDLVADYFGNLLGAQNNLTPSLVANIKKHAEQYLEKEPEGSATTLDAPPEFMDIYELAQTIYLARSEYLRERITMENTPPNPTQLKIAAIKTRAKIHDLATMMQLLITQNRMKKSNRHYIYTLYQAITGENTKKLGPTGSQ